MTESPVLAPRWRRLVGVAYESLLVTAIIMAAAICFAVLFTKLQGNVVELFFVGAAVLGYFVYCWRKNGQTLAMKTWRLQLLDHHQKIISVPAAAIRLGIILIALSPTLWGWMEAKRDPSLHWVYWITLFIAALPWMWSFIDRDRQFLHDRLAGTRIWLTPIG